MNGVDKNMQLLNKAQKLPRSTVVTKHNMHDGIPSLNL